MKKLGKILVILFTLVSLVSVVAIVASADTTSDVATVTIGDSTNSYATLKEAYYWANKDTTDATATITLLKDCEADVAFKVTRTTGPVVFDLNGKTLNVNSVANQGDAIECVYKNGYYDATGDGYDKTVKPEYGAISIETDGVTLTVDGNGGKITDGSVNTCPIYVLEGMDNSTLYVKDLEVSTTAIDFTQYAPIYVRGGKAYVDNCYVTTGFSGSPAIRHGANAYIEITDSLLEANAAKSSYATVIRLDGTGTSDASDANAVLIKNSSVIGGASIIGTHGYDSTSAHYRKDSSNKYGNGYNNRVLEYADGSKGPSYVNTTITFENCVIEQCDYDYIAGDTDCSSPRSYVVTAPYFTDFKFYGCDITTAWCVINSGSSTNSFIIDGCNLAITANGDIRMKVSGNVVTGSGVTTMPTFINLTAGTATVSNSTFKYDVDGYYGKKITETINLNTKYVTYKNNTIDFFQSFDELTVGSVVKTQATPLTAMSDGNKIERRIDPNGDYLKDRTNISTSITGAYIGGMIRQGDISIEQTADGNRYLCWDPTVVYNPYNNSQTKADSQIYVKFNGTAYVPATEGEDGAILVNAWKLNGDDVAEYIDVNNDGTADWVDADRSGVAYNGATKDGAITWEREIPEKYTLNEGIHQGYIGKNIYNSYASHLNSKDTKHNVSDVEYFVVDFDYSSGEGSTGFIKMTAAFEGRTSSGEATGSGFSISETGSLNGKQLTAGEWYHITCILKIDHSDVTKSIFKVFVDGEHVYTRTSGAMNAGVSYIDTLRFTVNNSTIYSGDGKLCLDNIKETVYPAGYTDAGVEALFGSNVDLTVWEKSYYVTSAQNGVSATVRNENALGTTGSWDWKNEDKYIGYGSVEAAIAGAKYGDVVTLFADADDIVKVETPMTVITNGYEFLYYSKSCYATEADGVITFTTVKPDELTPEDVEITYTQVGGTTVTENYGKLSIGSYAPIDETKVTVDVGYDTENGTMVSGVTLNGEAFDTIPKIASVYKYNLAISGEQYGWMILDASGAPYKVGIEYKDLAALVRASYNLKNNSTIKFYKDYNDYVYDTLEFYYSVASDGYTQSSNFYIDLNGHTIRVCGSNENSFIKVAHYMAFLETAKEGYTLTTSEGEEVTEYVHISDTKNHSQMKLLGDSTTSTLSVVGGRGAIYVHIDSSKPGAVVDNGTARLVAGTESLNKTFLNPGSTEKKGDDSCIAGMTTNSYTPVFTDKDGNSVDISSIAPSFPTATVNVNFGTKNTNVVHYKANSAFAIANNAVNVQIKNILLDLNGSVNFRMANGTLNIYDSTIVSNRKSSQTHNGIFSTTNTITSVRAYRTNFISTNTDGAMLFSEASLRYHGNKPGLVFEDCNFYNVKIAAHYINASWSSAQNYKSSQYCGPALEEGEKYGDGTNNAVLKTDKTRIFLTGTCTTNMPYGNKTDGRKSSDGLYYPALTNRVDYNAKAVADMQIGLWNNSITDTRIDKSYEMKYIISDDINLVDVTFNYADTTETVKYAVGGTIKNNYKYTPTTSKVMACTHGWDKAFGVAGVADTYTYNVTYKPTISVFQNLSLYSNFKYNLYIPVKANGVDDIKNYVSSIYLGGEKQTVEETATIGGVVYYVFTVENIDSNKTAENIRFEITLKDGNAIAEGAKTLSVLGYLETALKNTNAETKAAEYKLYQATLNYTKCAYDAFGGDSAAVVALWNTYCKDKLVEDAIDTTIGTGSVNGLDTAALNLVAAPAFRFTTLDKDADITVTYKFNNNIVTKSTGDGTITLTPMGEGKYYFDIELRAYQFFEDISITVDGGEVGTYNLANYYNGLAASEEYTADLGALVKALNTYARAAAAYNK